MHEVRIIPFLQNWHLFFLSRYTGQCPVLSVLMHLFGVAVWTDRPHEYAGASSRDLRFDGLPTGQSIGLRQNINPSATFVVNCTNVSWMDNCVIYLLYRSQALTLHISAQCTKTLIYHLLVFNGALYKAISISTKSTPPIAELYSLTASGHGTCKYLLLFRSHLSTVPDDSAVEYVDATWTHLLPYHRTIVRPEFISYFNDTLPRPFFLKSFSDSKKL